MESVTLVIARYNEYLSWLNEFDLNHIDDLFIYNKGDPYSFQVNNHTTRVRVISLPNVGREAHTYLYHIVNHYYAMPSLTIFLMGSSTMEHKYERAKSIIEISRYQKSRTIVLHPAIYRNVKEDLYDFVLDEWQSLSLENKAKNPDSRLEPSPIRPFGKWYQHHFPDVFIRTVSYNGIFAISKDDIQSSSLNKYADLLREVSKHSNTEVAHYLERAWLALFHAG